MFRSERLHRCSGSGRPAPPVRQHDRRPPQACARDHPRRDADRTPPEAHRAHRHHLRRARQYAHRAGQRHPDPERRMVTRAYQQHPPIQPMRDATAGF